MVTNDANPVITGESSEEQPREFRIHHDAEHVRLSRTERVWPVIAKEQGAREVTLGQAQVVPR